MATYARMSVLLLAVAVLAGCAGQAQPPPPAGPAVPTIRATVPSPDPSGRTLRLGEPWTVPGWRIAVVTAGCERRPDATPPVDACTLLVSYLNTGTGPALFTGTADTPGPLSGATGFDAAGRTYTASHSLESEVNPGTGGTATLEFDVAPGVRLIRVEVAGVTVLL